MSVTTSRRAWRSCLASEYCAEVTQEAFRIHGGYGYSKEYEIERLMREAPFLLIGEGTSEIQKTIISRGLLREYRSQVRHSGHFAAGSGVDGSVKLA